MQEVFQLAQDQLTSEEELCFVESVIALFISGFYNTHHMIRMRCQSLEILRVCCIQVIFICLYKSVIMAFS